MSNDSASFAPRPTAPDLAALLGSSKLPRVGTTIFSG
jgi:hypothetical protein